MPLPLVGLEAAIDNLNKFDAAAKSITKSYDNIDREANKVEKSTTGLNESLLGLGAFAAEAAITAFTGALAAGVTTGFNYNMMLEETGARINAFTKDTALTADILEMLRIEAAKTPFSFSEMATAASSLLPVTDAANVSLEELMDTAEILAASNPMQGLEGASFSLREAVTGDFTSIIERFNLSRTTLNELKAQGVPALEAVQIAMQEMGFDSELVSNMALTMQGRWSTFSDTMTTLSGVIVKPMFDQMSESLGRLNEALDKGEIDVSAWTAVTQKLADGLDAWTFVLLEAIPAIDQHNKEMAEQAAQAAINATSQEELDKAWEQGRADFDTFKDALVKGSSSVEEYNKTIKAGAKGNYLLAESLTLTAEEFDTYKEKIDKTLPPSKDFIESISKIQNAAANARTAMDLYNAEIERNALAQQQAAQFGFTEMTNRDKAAMEELALARGQTREIEEQMNRERMQESADLQRDLIEEVNSEMVDSFESAAGDIKSAIESVIQPTLDEVWTPPPDAEAHFDEAARRLATVATSGFDSEWLDTLAQQFGTQSFFQPIIAAMEAGDPQALKDAATGILTTSVTELWDVDMIADMARQQLQQQQLRQRIVDEVAAELGMEGAVLPLDNITTSATNAGTAITGTATTLTTMLQPTFTTTVGTMTTITDTFVTGPLASLTNAISSIYLTYLPTLVNIWRSSVATITSLLGNLITKIGETQAAGVTMAGAIASSMDTVAGKISDAVGDFEDLIEIVAKATKEFEKMAEAAEEAANASRSAGSSATAAGNSEGFQHGTGPLGFTVPPGFPFDSFNIGVSSGEQVFVIPAGEDIETWGAFGADLFMTLTGGVGAPVSGPPSSTVNNVTNNYFSLEVATTATPQAVIQQYMIAKALLT